MDEPRKTESEKLAEEVIRLLQPNPGSQSTTPPSQDNGQPPQVARNDSSSASLTQAHLDYLRSKTLCRLATVGVNGRPHVVPASFRVNDDGTVDIGGHDFAKSKKWSDVSHNPWVSLVVDDGLPLRQPRFVEIRGLAQRRDTGGTALGPGFDPEHFHIVVKKVASFGIE
jgi:pyridoxamine 5'-phosphate oxidase family protein